MQYPSLCEIVLSTIECFKGAKNLPKLDIKQFKTPLVVGSGNGYYTGRILFRNSPAYFAGESEFMGKIENISSITDVVVVSASGEKHAPIILENAKKLGKNTFLISSSEKSSGRTIADGSIVMPKIREPYTYNTSTYFGYMLAEYPESSLTDLEAYLSDILTPLLKGILKDIEIGNLTSFFLVIPNEFVLLREMFEVKFIELFGRKVARDIFSHEQMKHATTVVPDSKELFLCFENKSQIRYGGNQINIPLFEGINYPLMMLIGYFTIGKIQESLPDYFGNSIEKYCIEAKKQSGFNISPWVDV
ncbi:MAG: hypothetical protein HHAS10_00890 [Candidatus Altimarinota bacterium]